MKRVILYAISGFLVLGCSSCHKGVERMSVDVWDGHNFYLALYRPPVSIVWFKGSRADIPYKGFCRANKIEEIMDRLLTPENPGPPPKLPLVPGTHNSLCLFYYKTNGYVSRVVVVDFDIDEDGVFVGPRGKSPTLGKLLQEQEESGLEGCYGYIGPVTEEIRTKSKAVSQQMREYLEQQQKELESRPFDLSDMTLDAFSEVRLSCQGILIRRSDDSDPNHAMVLFGELYKARWIVGHDIQVDKVFRYPGPMITVFAEFRKAERVHNLPAEGDEEYQVIFLDRNNRKGYRIKMGLDKRYVYGPGYRSRQLRKEFTKLGLFEDN